MLSSYKFKTAIRLSASGAIFSNSVEPLIYMYCKDSLKLELEQGLIWNLGVEGFFTCKVFDIHHQEPGLTSQKLWCCFSFINFLCLMSVKVGRNLCCLIWHCPRWMSHKWLTVLAKFCSLKFSFNSSNTTKTERSGLRLHFIVYPDSSHNADILNFNSSIDIPRRSILEELILKIALSSG